jgi:hypothetical protein
MSVTKVVRVTLNKKSVVDQFPEMVVKHDYLETDTFEDGLEYGPETIRKEPPLNKVLYTFQEGAKITYLGSDIWLLEADINKPNAIKAALRRITPVSRNYL